MTEIELTAPSEDVGNLVESWLVNYITQPHQEIGRSGAICPFVEPSIKAKSLVVRSARWRSGFGVADMVGIVETSMAAFSTTHWESVKAALHALVVTVADLPRDAYWLIDEAHRITKDDVVANGLMLGQFHPECAAPAARSTGFPVNRAPVPLFVIRNMAIHDILFLHENDAWFAHYLRRYGHYFESPHRTAPDYVALVDAARARLSQKHA